jgi:hypothetical protein
MFDDGFQAVDVSGDEPELATLFCHQIHVLNQPLPSQLLLSVDGDLLVCVMRWPAPLGFRFPDVAAMAMAELAEVHLHRRIGEVRTNEAPDREVAVLYVFLAGSTEEPGERAEAMAQWAMQARRVAREHRVVSIARGTEAKDLRALSRLTRRQARRARRRRHHAAPSVGGAERGDRGEAGPRMPAAG